MLDAKDALEIAQICASVAKRQSSESPGVSELACRRVLEAEIVERRLELEPEAAWGCSKNAVVSVSANYPAGVFVFRPGQEPLALPPAGLCRWLEECFSACVAGAAGDGLTAGLLRTDWEEAPFPVYSETSILLEAWLLEIARHLGYRCACKAPTVYALRRNFLWFFISWSVPYPFAAKEAEDFTHLDTANA